MQGLMKQHIRPFQKLDAIILYSQLIGIYERVRAAKQRSTKGKLFIFFSTISRKLLENHDRIPPSTFARLSLKNIYTLRETSCPEPSQRPPKHSSNSFGMAWAKNQSGKRQVAKLSRIAQSSQRLKQQKSLLRGGLEGMKFPTMMWLGYMTGLQRGLWKMSGRGR